MITPQEFKNRRTKVLEYLQSLSKEDGKHYKCVLQSGSQKNFSNDVYYKFRVDSDFYYLTGFIEPNSIAVLDPYSENPFQLYVQPIDPQHAIWEGHREGIEGAKKNFHADVSYDKDQFKDDLEPNGKASSMTRDITRFIHTLRSVKSQAEIALMKKSASIALQAHRVAKEIITPGIKEYEIEAIMCQVFRFHGASGWAYPPIVASGLNSCVLHYIENDKLLKSGDLVLIDAGCEYNYYASDITRVHAVSGSMTKVQQDIYDVVMAAQQAAIASIKPGMGFIETHNIAWGVIAQGLFELGYITDRNDKNQVKKYFMHSTGHSLGIDVHDVGVDKNTTKYVPGMVTTVEPGIYIREQGFGIRIEDDVLVTNTGSEILA